MRKRRPPIARGWTSKRPCGCSGTTTACRSSRNLRFRTSAACLRGTNGTYHLVKNNSTQSDVLHEALEQIRQVIGEKPFTSVRAVRDYLNRRAQGMPSPA
ncbi:hypothetical protein LP419_33360 [Massilia sp. H-1]|nr:hypothetical protein LP419_33360 [Massilia sp. H-1]